MKAANQPFKARTKGKKVWFQPLYHADLLAIAHRQWPSYGGDVNGRIITILLLTAYCYFAAFTVIEDGAGQGISGRVVFADFFLLGLFVPAFFLSARIRVERTHLLYLLFLAVPLISTLLSERPSKGIVELLVLVFNFAAGLTLFNLMAQARSLSLADVVLAMLYAWLAIAVLGLLQFLIFPGWFSGRQIGGLVGTFRNTGQSGTYFGMGLAIFLPALFSGLIKRNALNLIAFIVILIAFLLTVKRAAILGFGIGLVGVLFMAVLTGPAEQRRNNIAVLVAACLLMPAFFFVYDAVVNQVSGFEGRISRKVNNFSFESFMDKFFGENSAAALAAFADSPLVGVGLSNVAGVYSEKYEVHSTPLSILSSSGLLGFALYLLFLGHWLSVIWASAKGRLIENRFMQLFMPMAIGLIISWGYTYHIRKREFWILYAVTIFASWLLARAKSVATPVRPGGSPAPGFPPQATVAAGPS